MGSIAVTRRAGMMLAQIAADSSTAAPATSATQAAGVGVAKSELHASSGSQSWTRIRAPGFRRSPAPETWSTYPSRPL